MTTEDAASPDKMNQPGRLILLGIGQSIGARALTFALQFVTLLVLARGLGPEGLGIAQFYFVVFTYLVLLGDPGLSVLGGREEGRESSRLTSPGVLLGARLLLLAPLVGLVLGVAAILADRSSGGSLIASVLILGVAASALSMRWLLLARHAFAAVALCELAAAVLQLAGAAAVVSIGLGDVAGLAVLVAGPGLVALLTYVASAMSRGAVRPALGPAALRLLRLALPLGVASLATAIYYSFDSLVLGLTRGSAEVGIYAAAYRIVLASLALPVIVHGVALPVIAKSLDTDQRATGRILGGLSTWLMVATIPVATAVTLLAAPIVDLLYGEPFAASAVPLSILIWSLVTVSANVPFALLLLAARRDRAYLGVTVLGAVANVVLNVAVIPSFGYVGAAATTLACELVVLGSFVWLTRPLSVTTLRASVPLGVVPGVAVGVVLSVIDGPLLIEVVASGIAFMLGIVVLLATGRLREALAMVRRAGR